MQVRFLPGTPYKKIRLDIFIFSFFLLGNKDKDIYNDIVEDLRNKDFLSSKDYDKIHMKPVIKKIEIKEEKEQEYGIKQRIS